MLLGLVKVQQMHCLGQQHLCDSVELLLVLPPAIAAAAMLAMAGMLGKCCWYAHVQSIDAPELASSYDVWAPGQSARASDMLLAMPTKQKSRPAPSCDFQCCHRNMYRSLQVSELSCVCSTRLKECRVL